MDIPQVKLDNLSYMSVPLKLMLTVNATEVVRGTGTGFFVRKDNKTYLVTNRHVLIGKNFPVDRPQYINYPIPFL